MLNNSLKIIPSLIKKRLLETLILRAYYILRDNARFQAACLKKKQSLEDTLLEYLRQPQRNLFAHFLKSRHLLPVIGLFFFGQGQCFFCRLNCLRLSFV
jgi:hypothetical protein